MSFSILALSSSRSGNSGYLEMAAPAVKHFLGDEKKTIAFIPFAAVENDYEAYGKMVKDGLSGLPYHINVVQSENAVETIEKADVVMVGGGNTFKLLHDLYFYNLVDLIYEKVSSGIPYIGWSAGANLTGLTISTTNDMPIIQPPSFKAFGFFNFQINPHYANHVAQGFNGETRDQRLTEFVTLNTSIKVVGIPEGSALQLKNNVLDYIGHTPAKLFFHSQNGVEINDIIAGSNLSYLL